MKIWIDILTPKQLLFFEPIVEKLQKKHVVICTGRKYRELSNLAKIRRFRLKFIGKHGGKNRSEKLRSSIQRMSKIQQIIEKEKPDLTISFCSPEASRISFGLGINHIGFSDSPHATAVMKLYAPLIQKLLIPSIIPKSEFTQFGINEKNIVKYNAIDASVITKHKIAKNQKNPFSKNKKIVLVRVGEEQAAYVKKRSNIDLILKQLSENLNAEIVVLGRYHEQIKRLKKQFGKKIKILTKSYDGKMLLTNADVFIGSGGTMTAESALLGTPTISYNAIPNLVEDYLVKKKLVRREENPSKIPILIEKMLREEKNTHSKRSKKLLKQMQDPYLVLTNTIKILK